MVVFAGFFTQFWLRSELTRQSSLLQASVKGCSLWPRCFETSAILGMELDILHNIIVSLLLGNQQSPMDG